MSQRIIRNARATLVVLTAAAALLSCRDAKSERQFTLTGEEREVRGTVVETELTQCGPTPDKPGTCAGMMVLEPLGGRETDRIALEVTRDIALKKGEQTVFLPQLKGSVVVARYVATAEGPKIATSVVAMP